MENEDAFAAEAQDEAVLSSRRGHRNLALHQRPARSSSPNANLPEDNQSGGEGSPLLPPKSATIRTASSDSLESFSSESYERAINQPWLGARGSEGLPWYKKPSVSDHSLAPWAA